MINQNFITVSIILSSLSSEEKAKTKSKNLINKTDLYKPSTSFSTKKKI